MHEKSAKSIFDIMLVIILSSSEKIYKRQEGEFTNVKKNFFLLISNYWFWKSGSGSLVGADTRKKRTASNFPGFPILFNVSPIFLNVSPIFY